MSEARSSRKRVRFNAQVSSSSPQTMAKEELKALWYNRQDLSLFKYQAREIVSSSTLQSRKGDILRGFEGCSLDRQWYKHMTIQCTVSAYEKGMSRKRIASMAQRCGEWNKEVAFIQACHDYFEIYRPSLVSEIPEVPVTPPKFPFAMKRAAVDTTSNRFERRVRRRTQ